MEVEASCQLICHCHLLYALENCTVGNAMHFSNVRGKKLRKKSTELLIGCDM